MPLAEGESRDAHAFVRGIGSAPDIAPGGPPAAVLADEWSPGGTVHRPDDSAVVDSQLRVRGPDGLRVVDASVMPTMGVAERAADLMRA